MMKVWGPCDPLSRSSYTTRSVAEPNAFSRDHGSPRERGFISSSRDQRTIIVIEDGCQRTGILQTGWWRNPRRGPRARDRTSATEWSSGARRHGVEDAIRVFRVPPECFGPSLGHRVTAGTDAAVGMCREPSQRRTRREIDEIAAGRVCHDDTQATLSQEGLAHNVASGGRSQALSERLEERTTWIRPQIQGAEHGCGPGAPKRPPAALKCSGPYLRLWPRNHVGFSNARSGRGRRARSPGGSGFWPWC